MQANVKLSKEESDLVQNADWILTKRNITSKVYALFGSLSEEYQLVLKSTSLQNLLVPEAKIARGEQYEHLPYVMLDFPRQFSGEKIFAIRSFFWWGNFFSITLHVSGVYKKQFFPTVAQMQRFSEWEFGVNDDQWRNDFRSDNYRSYSAIDPEQILQRDFIKIAKKIPLSEWNNSYSFFTNHFKFVVDNLVS